MKSFTDIEQSKKLAKILPIESADMHYNNVSIKGINYIDEYRAELMDYNTAQKVLSKYLVNPMFSIIPCWSLAALLNILPSGKAIIHDKEGRGYKCICSNIDTCFYDNPVDACVEMVLKLKEKDK